MGWSGGNEIFDVVARKVTGQCFLVCDDEHCICVPILDTLIRALQDAGWDTEDESLERFVGVKVVVEAFRRRGIVRESDDE